MRRLSVLLLIMILGFMSMGATYYVSFTDGNDGCNGSAQTAYNADTNPTNCPLKYAPGMSGESNSVTLYSADTVILRGGDTWTFTSTTAHLWTLPASGITVQGGQRLDTPWGTGYPVIDGTGSTAERSGIYMSGKTNIILDGLEIYNTFYATAAGAGTGITFSGLSSGLEIKNCYLYLTGNQSILGYPTNGTETIKIHNNIFEGVNRLFIAVADNNVVNDIQIYSNTFKGNAGFTGTAHGDGMMIGSGCVAGNTCLTNLKIHHNIFKGSWLNATTALIFLNNGTASGSTQYGGNHVEIYDNQLAIDTDGYISPGFIAVWSKWNDIKIYNNTFGAYYSGSKPVSACISFWDHGSTNVDIKNNIFSGCTNSAISAKSTIITAIDYNVYSPEIVRMINGWVGTSDCRTAEACYSSFGQEQHGLKADPKFTTLPTGSNSGDWTLQSDSPAINIGSDLSASFTTDLLGNARPTGANSWDMGAYERGGTTDETHPIISSATINTDGDTLTLVFDEVVTVNTSTGFTLGMSGGAAGLTYTSGSGTATLIYAITGRTIDDDETGTLDYDTVANGIEDAAGNDLASTGESDIAVTNNSEYSPSATTFIVTVQSSGNCTVSPLSNQVIVSGEAASYTCTAYGNSGCAAWTGTCGGTGTTSFTSSAVTGDCTVIQGCYKIAPDVAIGSGWAAVTLGSGAVATLY